MTCVCVFVCLSVCLFESVALSLFYTLLVIDKNILN